MSTEDYQNEYVQQGPPAQDAAGATGSMVCGILGVLMCPLLSIFAVVMGHKAKGRIHRSRGQLGGDGKATAGLITGYIGLVLGVLVVPLMAAILVPAVTKVISDAEKTQMKSNGKNIYVSVFADAIDTDIVGFPEKDEFQTSTDYFKALAGDNPKRTKVLAATPDFISGPHVEPAIQWSQLQAENVGWCVVEGFDEATDAGMPFLISSNIKARNLSELNGPVGNHIVKTPLGNKVVVAYFGGGSEVLDARDIWPNHWPDAKILHP